MVHYSFPKSSTSFVLAMASPPAGLQDECGLVLETLGEEKALASSIERLVFYQEEVKRGMAEYLPGSFPATTESSPPACSPKLNMEISPFPHYRHPGTGEHCQNFYSPLQSCGEKQEASPQSSSTD